MTFDSRPNSRAPADVAAALERARYEHRGNVDDVGYGVWGLSFASGDVLAFRRFPPTAHTPGYTCVWHRSPDGLWTFYADVGEGRGCHRHFGPCVDQLIVTPIRVEWTGPFRVMVTIDGGRKLSWSVVLTSSLATTVTGACLRLVPRHAWGDDRAVRILAVLTAVPLRMARLPLAGRAPSGDHFLLRPLALWRISASRASVLGRDLGPLTETSEAAALGEFVIPRTGLFVVGGAQVCA